MALESYAQAVFSPNGQIVALVDYEHGIKLWDLNSGRLLRTLQYATFFLDAVFTPDGKLLISSHKDGAINLWDLTSDRPVATLKDKGVLDPDKGETPEDFAVYKLILQPAGEFLAAPDRHGNVTVWNIEKRKKVYRFSLDSRDAIDGSSPVARFTLDGSKLVVEGAKEKKALDLKTGKITAAPRDFSFDGSYYFPEDGSSLSEMKEGNCQIHSLQYRQPAKASKPVTIDAPALCAPPAGNEYYGALSIYPHHGGKEVLIARQGETKVKIWNKDTRHVERSFELAPDIAANIIGVSPDLSHIVSNHNSRIRLIELASGTLVREFKIYGETAWDASVSRSGSHVIVISFEPGDAVKTRVVRSWKLDAVGPQGHFTVPKDAEVMDIASDGSNAVILGADGDIVLLSVLDGRETQRFKLPPAPGDQSYTARRARLSAKSKVLLIDAAALPPPEIVDGEKVEQQGDSVLLLADVESGKVIQTLEIRPSDPEADDHFPRSIAVSLDGTKVAAGYDTGSGAVWDAATGKLLKVMQPPAEYGDNVQALSFSDNGAVLAGGTRSSGVYVWDVSTGKLRRELETESRAGHAGVVSVSFSHDGKHIAAGLSERSRSSGDVGAEHSVKVWNAESGDLLLTLDGHESGVVGVTFTRNDQMIVSAGFDGTLRYWDRETGKQRAVAATAEGSRWITITDAGFFAGSAGSEELVNVVRGLEPYTVSQFRDHLYRPDLVEEFLKGDPEGKYKDAAFNLNLEKVLDSGPAPALELLEKKTEQLDGKVRLTVRINGAGGGIGNKLLWRVNGITQGNPTPEDLKGLVEDVLASAVITETLTVDPGQANTVEVTAYNGAGLLASAPLMFTVDKFGVTTTERPRMHVLAIGVDKYRMKDFELKYAVKDATNFAEAMKAVGSTLFSSVEVTPLYDEQVTRENIAAAFTKIGAAAKPSDVFVLFLGGHGKSVEARYYYYPQTLDFAAGQTYADGIGQDLWQQWLAKIPAQKTLLVLDTCESGAAGGLIRGGESTRQTAMDQLQHATGQNLIAAAGSSKAAIEGYKGHGVLTYALLEALSPKEGKPADEKVKIGALADYVDEAVPSITQSVWGVYQKPTRKLSGNDFPIGVRTAALLSTSGEEVIPDEPTHFLIRDELARKKAEPDAESSLDKLESGFTVRVVKLTDNGFALIARRGKKLGYVSADALKPLQ